MSIKKQGTADTVPHIPGKTLASPNRERSGCTPALPYPLAAISVIRVFDVAEHIVWDFADNSV